MIAQQIADLPELQLDKWEATRNTLQLFVQEVGKIRLAVVPPKNHWWHVPLYVSERGLTTRAMPYTDMTFSIDFDFILHDLVVRTSRGDIRVMPLYNGLSVAGMYHTLFQMLDELGIEIEIRPEPFGMSITTPFPQDTVHDSYDREYVERFWRVLTWSNWVFDEFAGWFNGKTSPVHLFWHSFDLAVSRFSGRKVPVAADADAVTRQAYSHEVISFGFWPGDRISTPFPAFYSYTAPSPEGLTRQPLQPAAAEWKTENGTLAILPYESVRTAASPRTTLLAFLQSAYTAGAITAGWDMDDLACDWAPQHARVKGANAGFGRT